MENYRATVKYNLNLLKNSKKELKDIYSIVFCRKKMIAYERLNNLNMESKTYEEVEKEIEKFALYLKSSFKMTKDEYIGIDLSNGPFFIIAFWGSLMAGYSPYLINRYYPLDLNIRLLDRLNIKKVITLSNDFESYIKIDIEEILKNNIEGKLENNNWANTFALSSSLTGLEAKIVVYEGSSIASEILNSDKIIAKNPLFMDDFHKRIKVAAILPFFHIFGIMVSYLRFAFFNRTIVFFNDLSPETIRATIIRHEITHIFAPPLLFNKLYEGIKKGVNSAGEKKKKAFNKAINLVSKIGDYFPRLALKLSRLLLKEVRIQAFGESPRFMISGGSYIDSNVLKIINGIGYPLFNGYGTTEASITGANLSLKFSKRIDGSVGEPFPSVSYSIDKDGILYIEGTSLAKRIIYLNGKEEVIEKFFTKDLFSYENGKYLIKGRKDDLFIGENGENISPDLIEKEINLSLAESFSVLEVKGKLSLIIQYKKGTPHLLIEKEVDSIRPLLSKIKYGNNVNDILLTYDDITNHKAIKMSRAQLRKAIKEDKIHFFSLNNIKKETINKTKEDETLLLIEDLFKASLGKEISNIKKDSDYFIDLGGDSLGYMSLLVSIEKTFDITINLEKEDSLRTPEDFYNKIRNKQ